MAASRGSAMNPSTRFADVAAPLAANGYRPVPIKPGVKHPGFDDWQHFTFAPGCEKHYPKHGAGVLLGDVVGLDVDVDDPDAAAAIETAAREILHIGDAAEIPRRTGRAPRVLLPFRTSAPFRKITSALFKMRSTGTSDNKVEVLAEGQQFVAYHVHPDTRRPYVWNGGGDLLDVPRDQLFEITEAQAREIVRQAETILEEWGDRVEAKPGAAPHNAEGDTIPKGGRNAHLTSLAGTMQRRGMLFDSILAALKEENARRCNPPLPDDEVDTVARSVARYRPGADASRDEAPEITVARARLPADWVEVQQQQPPFIVDGLLPKSEAGSLVGPGGSSKSTISLYESVHIILDRPLYGRAVLQPGVVLAVSKEDRA